MLIKDFFSKKIKFIRNHSKISILSIGLFLILICTIFLILTLNRPAPEIPKIPKQVPIARNYYSPLTGLLVSTEAETKLPVTAIMIENSPDARPQSGLKDSGVVFEAIAEGGITRFVTLHQQDKPQIIGPVRSLRMYYIDWLAPFDASVAHVGGSKAALDEIRNGTYKDLDQFFYADTFWRSTDRYAPHNVYTSFEKLDALNSSKGYKSSSFTGFTRGDNQKSQITANSINIDFSSDWYNTSYKYDASSNSYLRSIGGYPSVDREAGQIQPTVVIAMHVDETTVMEDGYRQSINTIGSGKVEIFQNGTVISGTWNKSDRKNQIKFLDESGKEIKLARGQTWIAAVPNDHGNVSWQ